LKDERKNGTKELKHRRRRKTNERKKFVKKMKTGRLMQ
jgi:hypothetical protein